MAAKRKSRSSKAGKPSPVKLLVIFGLLVLALFYVRNRQGVTVPRKVQEEVTQLTSMEEYVGSGTVTREYDGRNYYISITAFIGPARTGTEYVAWLIDGDNRLEVRRLGTLEEQGDVFALNYQTDNKSVKDYEDLAVSLESQGDEVLQPTTPYLLKGSF